MPVWLRRTLLSLGAALLLAVLAAAFVLTHLELPWVKQRIATAAGFELDYDKLELTGLRGLHLEKLVVLNPPEVRATARELLRLDTLDVTWTLSDLPKVEQLTARGLTAQLVFDESGASSFPPSKEPAPPSPGLSKQLAATMKAPRDFDGASVKDVSVTVLRTGGGKLVERVSVSGLALDAKAQADGAGWKLDATLGDALEVARNEARASMKLAMQLQLDARAATLGIDLATSKQTFAPDLAVSELLHVKAAAAFQPEKGQVSIELEPSKLAGVANVEGALVLHDDAALPPELTRAAADAKLGPLLALLPAGAVPFTLDDGDLSLDATGVTLSAVPRFKTLQLDVTAKQLRMPDVSAGAVKLAVSADPASTPDAVTARATLDVETLETADVKLPSGHLELKVAGLTPAPASPARVAGDVALSLELPSLTAKAGELRIAADEVALEATAPLPQRAPFALKADLPLGALRVKDATGRQLLNAPARLQLDLTQATLDLDGRAQAVLDVAKVHATLDATKAADDLAYTLALETPELGIALPFLDEETAGRAPWRQLSAKLDSQGKVTGLGAAAPAIDHRTTLAMPRLDWDRVQGRDVVLALRSKGDALAHEGDAELKMGRLRAGMKQLGPQHLAAAASVDRRKLSLRTTLATRTGPKLSLSTALAFDAARKALKTNAKLELKDAEGAAPLLVALDLSPAALDLKKLQLGLTLDGAVHGLVESLTPAGEVKLAPELQETVGFEGTGALDVTGFRWQEEGLTLNVPALKWRSQMHAEGPKRTARSTLELERVSFSQSDRRTIATNVAQQLDFSIEGALAKGALSLKQTVRAATIEQRPALPVPVKNASFALTANREAGGLIHLSDIEVKNPETSTELSMRGTLDLSDKRRQLTVRGTLKQDLAALKLPELFEGRGGVELAFRVASPELDVFRTRSKLKFKDVHLKLPDNGIEVEGLEGEVAVNESVRFGSDGIALTKEIDTNPYSMLRFADQHPLLSTSSFITAQRISSPYGEMKPFAGNLTINQNVVSMSQLELGLRGGRVTGQCTVDLQGQETTMEAHVRATGVQSSRGEPFDGNAAVVISVKDRSVNGRAEVLRIGNQHLRDLLDIQDPQHVDPGINRIRYALTVGYPEHLRLVFDHGFASMKISFGGAARLLKVDDVRGIPVGPLLSRALASVSLPE